MGAHNGGVEHLDEMRRRAHGGSASKKASNTPDWLNRQNRFQTLFQLPKEAGNARHVMLWTEK